MDGRKRKRFFCPQCFNDVGIEGAEGQVHCALCGSEVARWEASSTRKKGKSSGVPEEERTPEKREDGQVVDLTEEEKRCQRCTLIQKEGATVCEACGTLFETRFGFFQNRVHGAAEQGSVDIATLVNEFSGMEAAWVSTMDLYYPQVDKLFQVFHSLCQVEELLVIHGMRDVELEIRKALRCVNQNAQSFSPTTLQFGTHHSKSFLLFSKEKVRVIIHTANLIDADLFFKSEGVYYQDFCKRSEASPVGENFQFGSQLQMYFEHVFDNAKVVFSLQARQRALARFDLYDFTTAKPFLIATVPGRGFRKQDGWGQFGLSKHLRSYVRQDQWCWPVVLQFTSLGGQGKSSEPWLLSELVGQTMAKPSGPSKKSHQKSERQVYVVFPTEEDCKNSVFQLPYGLFLNAQGYHCLRDKFCSWGRSARSRKICLPHIKSYCSFNPENPNELAWCCITSANASKAAWGAILKDGTMTARSFELGVLFCANVDDSTKLVVQDNGNAPDSVLIMPLPYTLPPVRYGVGDVPGPLGRYEQEFS